MNPIIVLFPRFKPRKNTIINQIRLTSQILHESNLFTASPRSALTGLLIDIIDLLFGIIIKILRWNCQNSTSPTFHFTAFSSSFWPLLKHSKFENRQRSFVMPDGIYAQWYLPEPAPLVKYPGFGQKPAPCMSNYLLKCGFTCWQNEYFSLVKCGSIIRGVWAQELIATTIEAIVL